MSLSVTSPEVLSYVEDSLKTIETLEKRIQVLEQDKISLEKIASSSKLDEDILNKAVDELEKLAFVDSSGKSELKAYILEKPSNVFNVISKIASMSAMAPSSGSTVRLSANNNSRDPFGWSDFFNHPVYK